MPERMPVERLQPCLLDRLTDEDPDRQKESREERVLSPSSYRRAVLRDITWLFNTVRGDWEGGHVSSSVVNYGIRDFTGMNAEALSIHQLEREIMKSIERFEPRILAETLTVRGEDRGGSEGTGQLYFEISGVLWAQPISEELDIRTEVDLGTGRIEVHAESYG